MSPEPSLWHAVANIDEVPSPALLIYPDRVQENIRRMIAVAGGTARLRPHVKTHKLSELIHFQMAQGIRKFKTATIAETEIAAVCGASDVLLAYPPVGPNIGRLIELARRFPSTRFSAIADSADLVHALSRGFAQAGLILPLFLDIDCGMHRTGVAPDDRALELYELMARLPGLMPAGLHAYDGHIHDADLAARTRHCHEAFVPVQELRSRMSKRGFEVPATVVGGTPTFPIHALKPEMECSPGTCLLWDAGYEAKFPDLAFLSAALVITRVISKPCGNRLCLDLGHKAVASENPPPRVHLIGLPSVNAISHSEEHLVVETAQASEFSVGHVFYGVPWHICPTVALYDQAVVIQNGRAQARWQIAARNRILTV